jgi:methyl-accepting chemotaxis protein
LHAVARVIAGRSTTAIQSQDFGQAEALVSALRVEPNVEEALLIDSKNRVLMHYAGSKTLLIAAKPGELTSIQKWQKEAIQSGTHQHRFDGLTALHLVYPITDQGKLSATCTSREPVELQERSSSGRHPARSSVSRSAWPIYWRGGAAQIASPLLNLVETMQAAERGDYSRRADVTSDDEIGTLMHGYNGMLARSRTRQELARQHELAEPGGGAHQSLPSEPNAAPGHERQRRACRIAKPRARPRANSSRACRTKSARP